MISGLNKNPIFEFTKDYLPRVAVRAAELYKAGLAPRLMFSGGRGNFTQDWDETEAEKFAAVAVKEGVPESAILLENKSSNTGENIMFSYNMLQELQIVPKSVLLVQKPFMERRYK